METELDNYKMHPALVVYLHPLLYPVIDSHSRPRRMCPASGSQAMGPLLAVADDGQHRLYHFYPLSPVLGLAMTNVPVGRLLLLRPVARSGPDAQRRVNLGQQGWQRSVVPGRRGASPAHVPWGHEASECPAAVPPTLAPLWHAQMGSDASQHGGGRQQGAAQEGWIWQRHPRHIQAGLWEHLERAQRRARSTIAQGEAVASGRCGLLHLGSPT